MDKEYQDQLKLETLIFESIKLVRLFFLKTWQRVFKHEWKDDKESAKYFKENEGEEIRNKIKHYQQPILDDGDSTEWDLSMFDIILNSRPFRKKSLKKLKSIEKMIEIRDKLNHNVSMILSDLMYKQLLEELSLAMISFGSSQLEIENIINNKDIFKQLNEIIENEEAKQIKECANEEYKRDDFEKAIVLYSKAISMPSLTNQEYGVLYCNRSFAYLKFYNKNGNKDDEKLYRGLNDAEQACLRYPIWFKCYVRLGQIYNALNDLENAKENFDKALILDPNNDEIRKEYDVIKEIIDERIKIDEKTDKEKYFSSKHALFNTEDMALYAFLGSPTASKIVDAKTNFVYAMFMLHTMKNVNIEEFITKLYYAYSTYESVCFIAPQYFDKTKEIIENVMSKNKTKKSSLDCMARVCYSHLIVDDSKATMKFLNESINKYNDHNYALLERRGHIYCNLREFKKGLEDFDIVLNAFPYDHDIMFYKGSALRLLGQNSFEKAIKSYESFLLSAPYDHEFMPEAFYAIGLCFLMMKKSETKQFMSQKEVLNKITKYYYKGLESENDQLPFFLPYKSKCKVILEDYIYYGIEPCNNIVVEPNTSTKEIQQSSSKVKESKRMDLLKEHRQHLLEVIEKTKNITTNSKNESIIRSKQELKSPISLKDFKEMHLKDIDFTKDQEFKKHFLKVRNIDQPLIGLSPYQIFIIEDENHYVERLAINNFMENYEEINKKYPVGCAFSVLNPHVIIESDGRTLIKVDDPYNIILSNNKKIDICRYCGKENVEFRCSKCKKASYCNRECQENDWKLLYHNKLCS